MKTPLLVSTLTLMLVFVTGCSDSQARKDIAALRLELRDHRFTFAEPMIEITILKREVLPKESGTNASRLRLTGVVRQVGYFPLKDYVVQPKFSVDAGTHKGISIFPTIPIKEGSGAFTTEDSIYLSDTEDLPTAEQISVTLSDFSWWEGGTEWKKLVTLKVQ